MNVKLTFKRKTKNNDYKRYFIEDGDMMYWVHTNRDNITWIRQRDGNDIENTIGKLPAKVHCALLTHFPNLIKL